jgi:hypothetical protein
MGALTIAMLRCALMYPIMSEYVSPVLLAVLNARIFKTIFSSFPTRPSTETINGAN